MKMMMKKKKLICECEYFGFCEFYAIRLAMGTRTCKAVSCGL